MSNARLVILSVCEQCLSGAGGECHHPECSFWMNRAPDIPLTPRETSGTIGRSDGNGDMVYTPYCVPEGYCCVSVRERNEGSAATQLLSDLDRNADGRHKGESSFGDPTGRSHGNPHLAPGTVIGYGRDGFEISVPDENLRDARNWYQPR